jgi:hypothetical protein
MALTGVPRLQVRFINTTILIGECGLVQIHINQLISAICVDVDKVINVCDRSRPGSLGNSSLTVTVTMTWEQG